ncbi:DGQHR domain-containing protein DpdB [Tolumonas osonensis]|uniref:DGQHR domain-containing protein n=1 Tax=Tolumonas osonensis TaxID=675874 RepID=A0A841GL18_9GAMM|nr:DGQHR domain-containing protein DpdB [Tolumonas osonensis]MBB6055490.1 DGQHR domain-containing protein [Tolumonas osonensis]
MGDSILCVPALKIKQGEGRDIFSLAVDGKKISQIASISRINRENDELKGYQRPEVLSHIKEIQRYIESSNPIIPNPIIIAFDESVSFEPIDESSSFGYLKIPLFSDGKKAGFIVDGQQRTAALRDADVENFMMPVSAFIAHTDEEQREQFMLVNSTKPLPKTLLNELAPYTLGRLPSDLQAKKFPSMLTLSMNFQDGPLKGLIKTATNPSGVIADTSIIKMIDASLREGALYRFRDSKTGTGDSISMLQLLNNFWTAVHHVFDEDWNKKPRYSRLLHGVGIMSLGSLMDHIDAQHMLFENLEDWNPIPTVEFYIEELKFIKDKCHWSSGAWDFGVDIDGISITRKWNQLQNVSKDIYLLSDYIVKTYDNA